MIKRLLEIEYIKLRYSRSTRVTSIIYMILTLPMLLIAMSILGWVPDHGGLVSESIGAPFSFPGVWLTGTMISTYLIIFPAILSILHVGGEFTQKIHRQHIVDGLSKDEYVLSKFLSVFIISAGFTLYTFSLCVLSGILIGGGTSEIISQVDNNFFLYIIGYFIYTFSVLSFAVLITFILRRTGVSIFAFIGYYFILENIIWWFTKYSFIPKYLPLLSVSNNIFPNWRGTAAKYSSEFGKPSENNVREYENYGEVLWEKWVMFDWKATFLAVVYIGIYFLIIKWIFSKRDL